MKNNLISITELSLSANVSNRIIRHYESIGLLEAIKKGNLRWFNSNAIETLADIRLLLKIGLSLQEIGILLKAELRETNEFKLSSHASQRKDLIEKISDIKNTSEIMLKKYEKL